MGRPYSAEGRIVARHALHALKPFGKHARPVEQFLVEGAHSSEPLLGEIPAFHADDVEAFQCGILAVDQAERDDVVAYAANAAHHHLRADAGELVHGRQPADEDEIADLAMAAERRRGREDHIVADLAVMPDMGAVHEVTAIADRGHAAPFRAAAIHGHGFADGAVIADLKPAFLEGLSSLCVEAGFKYATDFEFGSLPGDLRVYERAHKKLMRRPAFMGKLMLMLAGNDMLRERAIRSMAAKPEIFDKLLAMHVGHSTTAEVISAGLLLGWQFLAT